MECPKCKAEIDESLAVCSQCNKPLKSKQAKKKVCFLVKLLLYCILAIVALGFLSNSIEGNFLYSVFSGLAVVLLITLPLLAIAALIRISLKNQQLKGRIIAILILVLSSLVLYQIAYYEVPRARQGMWASGIICGSNLSGLGKALMIYAADHDDMLPAENWCDLLIEKCDVAPKSFLCKSSDSAKGESDYCLNKNAAGKKLSELPKDLVLLFEVEYTPDEGEIRMPLRNRKSFDKLKLLMEIFTGDEEVYLDRWNQIGGPELLAAHRHSRHDGGCNTLFADGSVRFEQASGLSQLKWSTDGTETFPIDVLTKKQKPALPPIPLFGIVSLSLIGILCIFFTAWILVKYKAIKHWGFVCVVALLSAGTGWFFGDASEGAYNLISTDVAGDIAGAFFGLLVGICFAQIIVNLSDKLKQLKYFVSLVSSLGMVTGIICSTLVHIVLMIVNKESNPFGIVIGIPHGILAGAILGAISGWIINKYCFKKDKDISQDSTCVSKETRGN